MKNVIWYNILMVKRLEISKIQNLTQDYEHDLVSFCKDLVKTPSVNGQNTERKIAKLVASQAEKLGLAHKLVALEGDRPNVFVGTNFKSRLGLLFVAHLDTVPVGDEKKWKYKPFGAEVKDERLYGRGAIDCKAGVALSLYALRILKDLGKPELAKFVGVVDEESGADSKLGAKYLLEKGLQAKAAIYTYPGVETITIGHRGGVRIWVEFTGEAVHTGSSSWQNKKKGANAIKAVVRFIDRLSEITIPNVHPAFPGYGFVLTPTLLQGGSGESIVPDRAKVLLDARLLPNHSNKEYIEKIRKLAQECEQEKIKFQLTIKNNVPGVVISPKEPLVKILKKLDKEVMNITPEVRGCGPWNEGYMFVKAGIPMVCGFGAEGDGVHSADEYLELSSLTRVLEIYVRAALELL